jgi:hypothetical protein
LRDSVCFILWAYLETGRGHPGLDPQIRANYCLFTWGSGVSHFLMVVFIHCYCKRLEASLVCYSGLQSVMFACILGRKLHLVYCKVYTCYPFPKFKFYGKRSLGKEVLPYYLLSLQFSA